MVVVEKHVLEMVLVFGLINGEGHVRHKHRHIGVKCFGLGDENGEGGNEGLGLGDVYINGGDGSLELGKETTKEEGNGERFW